MSVRVYFTLNTGVAAVQYAPNQYRLTEPGNKCVDDPIVHSDGTRRHPVDDRDTYYIALNDVLLDELPHWTYGERAAVQIVAVTVREEVYVTILPGHYTKIFYEKWKAEAKVTKSKAGYMVRISAESYLPCRQMLMDLLAGDITPAKEYLGTNSFRK